MKFVRFSKPSPREAETVQYGILRSGDQEVQPIAGNPFARFTVRGRPLQLEEVRLLAPVLPGKIVGVGVNYRAHAEEFSKATPDEPLIFLKPPTALIGPGDPIRYPAQSHRVDLEGELAVIIKRRTRRVTAQEAQEAILGYCCFNDVTARDLQKRDGQWTRAKGFDTFAPLGPCIATQIDPGDLKIESSLNGRVVQSSRTSEMLFDVYVLVSFISRIMTLLPGDVVATGTPSGVTPMQRGDVVEISIEGIGRLQNRVADTTR